jgi:hypothetical protein
MLGYSDFFVASTGLGLVFVSPDESTMPYISHGIGAGGGAGTAVCFFTVLSGVGFGGVELVGSSNVVRAFGSS